MEMRFTWSFLEVLDDETITFQKVTGRDVFKLNNLPLCTFLGEGKIKREKSKERKRYSILQPASVVWVEKTQTE